MTAVCEVVRNALVHRDYSFHTEGMPIQLTLYTDRMEIRNPGGLYGCLTVDQLGQAQPRNPLLVTVMETLGKTENRYSGIPTIRYAMKNSALPAPEFIDTRGAFKVVLYNQAASDDQPTTEKSTAVKDEKGLLTFCRTPRSKNQQCVTTQEGG